MTRKVYKYKIELIAGIQRIKIPLRGKIVHFAEQLGKDIFIWVEFNEAYESNIVERKFQIYGTGHLIEDDRLQYIGSVVCDFGFVWHLYEEINERCD